MIRQKRLQWMAGVIAAALLLAPGWVAAAAKTPRLVLQITVDALRGDLPGRYAHLFGDGGFRYLMNEGVHYTNAHYQHANTETIVGHVSLATGTVPAAHGMVGNVWFDPNVFIADFDGLTVASTHGSPWLYDTFVPVMFAGPGLQARTVSRPVTPYDVAPIPGECARFQAAFGRHWKSVDRGRGQLIGETPAPGHDL